MSAFHQLRRYATALALGVILSGAAWAQGASVSLGVDNHDGDAPVEITSESLELKQEQGMATFTGNVIVRQGEMTMTCDNMVVEYAPNPETGRDEIETIRMFGGVTFASPSEAAEAETAVYSLDTEIIVMTGGVLVTQGSTALSSDRLTYNLASGEGLMEGNVKTVLQQAGN